MSMLLNNELLNNAMRSRRNKKLPGQNENEHITTQNLWDTTKAVLRGKFIALQVYLKGARKISNKPSDPKPKRTRKGTTKQIKPRVSRRK